MLCARLVSLLFRSVGVDAKVGSWLTYHLKMDFQMKFVERASFYIFFVLAALNALVFVGTVIELFTGWVGVLGYVVGVIVSPVLSPAIIALPWFDAWVVDGPVNQNILYLWRGFMVAVLFRLIFVWGVSPRE